MCMNPLSRKLNGIFPKVEVKLEKKTYTCNHLLFIDDLKLFSEKDETLKEMVKKTEDFFKTIGLEVNKEKSATNSEMCSENALVLNADQGYK